jgi:hypothetical protein
MDVAILLITYKRFDTTKKVIEAIRDAKPTKLYIASNAARSDKPDEWEKVEAVRSLISLIDWPCEVFTLFRVSHLSAKQSISSAIDWFFDNEEEGIILEDDCLPHPDFFTFCQTLLKRYAQDERVWVVTGDNFQNGQRRGEASYYFSHYNHVWGWATWRRAWSKRDLSVAFWPKWKASPEWKAWLSDKVERKYWARIFDQVYRNKIDTWDYQWTACVWFNRGLTATPNVNLIANIGFDENATHTFGSDSTAGAEVEVGKIGDITHPQDILPNRMADQYVFDHHFAGLTYRFPISVYLFPKRVIKYAIRKLNPRKITQKI